MSNHFTDKQVTLDTLLAFQSVGILPCIDTVKFAEASTPLENQPKPHQVVSLTFPVALLEAPTTLGALLRSARASQENDRAASKLFSVLSLIATDPSLGTPANVDVASEAGRTPQIRTTANSTTADRDQMTRRTGDGPNSDVHDVRGRPSDSSSEHLMFTYQGHLYPKTLQFIEELVSTDEDRDHYDPTNRIVGYKLWFVVLDPNLDLGCAMKRVINSNAAIYSRSESREVKVDAWYINHKDIHTDRTFSREVLAGYLRSSLSFTNTHGNNIRERINNQITDLEDYVNSSDITDSSATCYPLHTLGKHHAFCVNMVGVCSKQTDPWNYFYSGPEYELTAEDVVENQTTAENADTNGYAVDNDFVVDNGDPFANIAADFIEDSEDEADVMEVDTNDNAVPGQEGEEGEDTQVDQHILRLRHLRDAAFGMFPLPKRVVYVPTRHFGRSLGNVPLPCIFSGKSRDDLRAAAEVESDVTIKGLSSIYHCPKINITDPETEEIRNQILDQRREVLLKMSERLDQSDRPVIRKQMYVDADSFLEIARRLDTMYMHQKLRKSVVHAAVDLNNRLDPEEPQMPVNYSNNMEGSKLRTTRTNEAMLPETLYTTTTVAKLQRYAKNEPLLDARLKNAMRHDQLRQDYDTTSQEYAIQLHTLRSKICQETFDIMSGKKNSQIKLPKTIKATRDFLSQLPIEQHFAVIPEVARNLSSYGNLKLWTYNVYTSSFNGYTSHRLYWLADAVHHNSAEYWWGLRPNLLCSGRHAAGKSFVFHVIELTSVPGTTKTMTHTSNQAHMTDDADLNYFTYIHHEASYKQLGIDENGRPVPADPFLKDLLTRQCTYSERYVMIDGVSSTKETETMAMANLLIATNELANHESALYDRFMGIPMARGDRDDITQSEASSGHDVGYMKEKDKVNLDTLRLLNAYTRIIFHMIETKGLPEISEDASKRIPGLILDRLRQKLPRNLIDDSPRTLEQLRAVARTLCVKEAAKDVFFTPLVRLDKYSGSMQNMDPKQLPKVSVTGELFVEYVAPRLYVKTEHVIDCISMFSFIYLPEVPLEILNSAVERAIVPKEDDVINTDAVHFMRLEADDNARELESYTANFNLGGNDHQFQRSHIRRNNRYDYRYVQISDASEDLYQHLASVVSGGNKWNSAVIRGAIQKLQKCLYDAHPCAIEETFVDNADGNLPADAYENSRTVVDDTSQSGMDAGILEVFRNRPLAQANRTQMNVGGPTYKYIIERDSQTESVPVVRVETVRSRGVMRKFALFVLAEFLQDVDIHSILRETISEFLNNNTVPPDRDLYYATSFPYTIRSEVPGTPSKTYPHIFDCIRARQNLNNRVRLPNHTNRTLSSSVASDMTFSMSRLLRGLNPTTDEDPNLSALRRIVIENASDIIISDGVDMDSYFAMLHIINNNLAYSTDHIMDIRDSVLWTSTSDTLQNFMQAMVAAGYIAQQVENYPLKEGQAQKVIEELSMANRRNIVGGRGDGTERSVQGSDFLQLLSNKPISIRELPSNPLPQIIMTPSINSAHSSAVVNRLSAQYQGLSVFQQLSNYNMLGSRPATLPIAGGSAIEREQERVAVLRRQKRARETSASANEDENLTKRRRTKKKHKKSKKHRDRRRMDSSVTQSEAAFA